MIAVDSTAGVVAFTDPDLNDRPTATINTAGETVSWQDATHNFTSELTPAQIALLEASVSISAEGGNTNTGTITGFGGRLFVDGVANLTNVTLQGNSAAGGAPATRNSSASSPGTGATRMMA